jgi:PhnB protein
MAQLNPYISFKGNCREAMNFYKDCFGGELTLQTMGESPMAAQTPPEKKDSIMHSTLMKDGQVFLMASDMADEGATGGPISLCVNCSSEEEINTFFSKLSEGAKITHPLKTEFWGGTFGQLTDKFGINWMFNYDKNQKG